jgi:4-amino-4-deoxy-L-arabinose transferase-like glycosyltransferase
MLPDNLSCNPPASNQMPISIPKGSLRNVILFGMSAGLLLFGGLGARNLWGSEDRWAEISRNILKSGDWFHPVINGTVYFDKPLFSYWWIVVSEWITGTLDEFTIRLPSVMAGIIVLWATFSIGRRLWDRQVAWIALWLLLSSYGFLFWTHTAAADMGNAAFIMLAVAWFFRYRDSRAFRHYLVFWLICGAGAQMKGLTAFVVPALLLLPWLVRERRLLLHLNLPHALAALAGIAFFLLPYLGAALLPLPEGYLLPRNELSGLDLVIRENVVRFFQPFDHRDPVYSYLYHVPRLLLPWVFVFIAALVFALRNYREAAWQERWLLEAILLVFLFFTLSGSRRWYYILPIVPFCSLLMASYLLQGPAGYLRSAALAATQALLAVAGLVLVASPLVLIYKDMPVSAAMWLMSAGLLLLLPLIWVKRARIAGYTGTAQVGVQFAGLVAAAVLLMWALFTVVLPYSDNFRQDKAFALQLKQQLGGDDRVAFYRHERADVVFYLGQDYAVPLLDALSLHEVGDTTVLIVEQQNIDELASRFPELMEVGPLLRQVEYEWQGDRSKYNLSAWRLPDAASGQQQPVEPGQKDAGT